MAKQSVIQTNKNREKLVAKYKSKREALLAIARDRSRDPNEIMQANIALAKLPRNSAPIRVRNRCFITGRGRGVYRTFGIARGMIRELGLRGEIPGLTKSSW